MRSRRFSCTGFLRTDIIRFLFVMLFLAAAMLHAQEAFLLVTGDTYGKIYDKDETNDYLARKVTFTRLFQETCPESIAFSIGNFIAPNYISVRSNGIPVAKALTAAGYSFAVLGTQDFSMGIDFLKQAQIESGLKLLSSNVTASGLDFSSFVRTELDGIKMFLMGLCSDDVITGTDSAKVKVSGFAKSVNKTLSQRKKGEFTVLACSLKTEDVLALVDACPDIDLIIQPRTDGFKTLSYRNTQIVCIKTGIYTMGMIRVSGSSGNYSTDIQYFNLSEVPEDPEFAINHRQILDRIRNTQKKVCSVLEPASFPEITTNILRELTGTEVAFVNKSYLREKLTDIELTDVKFDRIFHFNDSYATFTISGKDLKKLISASSQKRESGRLVWAGVSGNKINGLPIVDGEKYRASTIEYLMKGSYGYNKYLSGVSDIKQLGFLKDDLLSYLEDAGTVTLSGFRHRESRLKHTHKTRLDLSITDIQFNTNKELYEDRNINQLKGEEKNFFKGRLISNLVQEGRIYKLTHAITADVEKQKEKEETGKLLIISRHLPKNRKEQKELKIETSWNKLSNDRYPLTVNLSFLRDLNYEKYIESRLGISLQKNFVNQDQTGGLQLYLKNKYNYSGFDLVNYLDYFQGLTKNRNSVINLENRFSYALTRRTSWFLSLFNYFYRDKEISEWANQRKIYSGFSISLDGKRI